MAERLLLKKAKVLRHPWLMVHYAGNAGRPARWVVVAPGRLSPKAVVRNRYKRRVAASLREIITAQSGLNLVIVLSPAIVGKETKEIKLVLQKMINSIFVNP